MAKKVLLNVLGIVTIGILPWFFALWFLHHPGVSHRPGTNVGHLVQSSVSFEDLVLDPTLSLSEQNKWLLVWHTPRCDMTCHHFLNRLINIKKATGKYYKRIAILVVTDTKSQAQLKGVFFHYAKENQILNHKNTLYLVDPKGNMVLSYFEPVDDQGVLKDLKHLLRFSQIG